MTSEDAMRKYFLGGIAVFFVLIIGGLVWAIVAGPSAVEQGLAVAEQGLHFVDDNDPSQGPGESKVVVRMFEDLQCPSCRSAEPGVQYAMRTYGDRVRFVWNDFPLSTIHRNARNAANAARCAEEQGKFWEFVSTLYDNQPEWSELSAPTQLFSQYAGSLHMNTDAFTTCVANQTYLRKIQDDESEGDANNVQGTPTFFIGTMRYSGPLSNADWDKALKAALGES